MALPPPESVDSNLFVWIGGAVAAMFGWVFRTMFTNLNERHQSHSEQLKEHEEALHHIKLNYVLKQDLKEMREEILGRFDRIDTYLRDRYEK